MPRFLWVRMFSGLGGHFGQFLGYFRPRVGIFYLESRLLNTLAENFSRMFTWPRYFRMIVRKEMGRGGAEAFI